MPASPPTPTWNHPLMGADLLTLVRLLIANGGTDLRALPLTGALLGSALARAPVSLVERVYTEVKRRNLPPSDPPVFILGHWRSGTTHLFNVMSRDPQFAWVDPIASGMPWDFLLLGRLLRPLLERALPEDRYIDRIPVHADSPQEDEIGLASMQPVSYYEALYFPGRFAHQFEQGLFHTEMSAQERARWRRRVKLYADKLQIQAPGRTLLTKNPVYTGQVRAVREIWPDARFVHIRRNPYAVYQSTRAFYRKLLPRFALQSYRPEMADALILDAYPRMLAHLEADCADLPADRYMTVRFEDLEQAPLETLDSIYDQLGLPGLAAARPKFSAYLEGVASYKKNQYEFSTEITAAVDTHWGDFVRRWGYGGAQPARF